MMTPLHASVVKSVKQTVTTVFENIHDDWCSCWSAGHTTPDYSLCDCHVATINNMAKIIARGTAANRKQEAEIQRLSIKIDQLVNGPVV